MATWFVHNKVFAFNGAALALIILMMDQISKYYIRGLVEQAGGVIELLPFFNLVVVWNYGVSFGMMQAQSSLHVMLLIALTAAITVLFVVLLFRAETKFMALACGMVIGGALGNIIDRIMLGAVFDFLDFHAFGFHYPAFNIADSAVVIGIAMIVIDGLFFSRKQDI